MQNHVAQISLALDHYRPEVDMPRDAAHVYKWLDQFTPRSQKSVAEGTAHILSQLHLSKEACTTFIDQIITHKDLVQNDPEAFWASCDVINLPSQRDNPQHALAPLLETALDQQGWETKSKETNHSLYIDDFIFTGTTLAQNIKEWLKVAPDKHKLHILTFGYYKSGQQHTEQVIRKAIKSSKKDIKLKFHAMSGAKLMNFLKKRDISQSLWPTQKVLSNPAIQEYAYQITSRGHKIHYRKAQKNPAFMPEYARYAMEEEFLLAGLDIIDQTQSPGKNLKPLGYSPYPGFGFGSLVTMYHHCPRHCPLALWWSADPSWYPLMPVA